MGADGVDAIGLDLLPVLVCQFESGAEFGFVQVGEGCGDLSVNRGKKLDPNPII